MHTCGYNVAPNSWLALLKARKDKNPFHIHQMNCMNFCHGESAIYFIIDNTATSTEYTSHMCSKHDNWCVMQYISEYNASHSS